jgi:DNA helicase HerA-like ATPase
VPREKVPGFTSTRRVLTRIAKEGRKYGVSLGLVTQRPTEVSEVVLSQCNTLFAMRLSNDKDQSFIKYALPENMGGLINTLPALRTQEAIVAGEGVSLPMLIKFDNLEESSRPQTDLCRISHGWQQDRWSQDYVDRVIQRWRNQSR